MVKKSLSFDPSIIKTYSTERLGQMLLNMYLLERDERTEQGIQNIVDRLAKRDPKKSIGLMRNIYRDLLDAKKVSNRESDIAEKAVKKRNEAIDYRERIQGIYDKLHQRLC